MSPFPGHRSRRERGAVLLLVIILLLVLGVVGVSVVSRSSSEMEASVAKRNHDRGLSCADAAREFVMHTFQLSSAASLTTTSVTDGGSGIGQSIGGQTIASGHYDGKLISVQEVNGIEMLEGATAGQASGAGDQANRMVAARPSQAFQVMALCYEGTGGPNGAPRQVEVEFMVRMGI